MSIFMDVYSILQWLPFFSFPAMRIGRFLFLKFIGVVYLVLLVEFVRGFGIIAEVQVEWESGCGNSRRRGGIRSYLFARFLTILTD